MMLNQFADSINVYPLDPNRAAATNAAAPLTTPTHDGFGEAVQPGVIYEPNGWNGYKYWMAMNPFYRLDHTEAVDILASNDGDTWVVPGGLTNPITGEPGVGHTYADPDLFLSLDKTTLYVVYVDYVTPTDQLILLKSSTDGVTWGAPVTIITIPDATAIREPSIVWDGSQYILFGSRSALLEYRTATDITGPYSAATTCNLVRDQGAMPGLQWPYHGHFRYLGGFFYGFYTDRTNGYFMISADRVNWLVSRTITLPGVAGTWNARIYQGSLLTPANGQCDLFYSADDNDVSYITRIGRTTIVF